MSVKTLHYKEGLTYPLIRYHVETKLSALLEQVSRCVFDFQVANKLSLNLCYCSLFIHPLESGRNYTINDVCSNVKGILSTNLYSFLTALSDLGTQQNIKDSLKVLLHDCMSYETFQLLRVNPVQCYSVFLFYYVLLCDLGNLTKCSKLVCDAVSSNQPTLAWEMLYNFFEEEVIKHDYCN